MEWDDYLRSILSENTVLDTLRLDLAGEYQATVIPPIIKASILMLDRITAAQGNRNIFVFPERAQSAFIFALIKSIYNIAQGEIGKAYKPHQFKKGQKLKFQDCVMEFDRIGIDAGDGRERIYVDFTDMNYGLPIKYAPYMQVAETNLLSKFASFGKIFSIKDAMQENVFDIDLIKIVQDHKTHLNSSIFYVSPIMRTKEQFAFCKINGRNIYDLLLIGHTNPDGEVENLGPGQLSGHPAIVLTADVYSVLNAHESGAEIQTVIIDISNPNMIVSQLSAIEELLQLRIPVVCVTDIVNSFELQPLLSYDFNLWQWNEDFITEDLYKNSHISSSIKTKHYAHREIEYINTSCTEISHTLKLLFNHRSEVLGQSPRMNTLYIKLNSLMLIALRATVPISSSIKTQIQMQLSECENELSLEKRDISDNSYDDYLQIINNLRAVYQGSFAFPKNKSLVEYLTDNTFSCICIVVPEKAEKRECNEYWGKHCKENGLNIKISVIYPSEYWSQNVGSFDLVIVVGWLGDNNMRRILYSFNAEKYLVLMYDPENRWRKKHTHTWSGVLNNESNNAIIQKSLNSFSKISAPGFHGSSEKETIPQEDELAEIELVLRENRYSQYISGSGGANDETVETVPVNFVGGCMSFYKTSHKVITVTDIIVNEAEKITDKLPLELQVGDFVIVRESARDIIREIADLILSNSDKSECRELATKWREALLVENIFSSMEDIHKKLKEAGCTKNLSRVRSWMTDDDIIAPKQKDDLIYIARATEDPVLQELVDQVFDAAREVKNAHTHGGKYLSNHLKKTIAETLKSYGDIDPFNIWEPISLTLEDIGTVKILKIIDIGSIIRVDTANANRLIEEL